MLRKKSVKNIQDAGGEKHKHDKSSKFVDKNKLINSSNNKNVDEKDDELIGQLLLQKL